jgi:pimeloyl-ACP methyl ester carboxylesterase
MIAPILPPTQNCRMPIYDTESLLLVPGLLCDAAVWHPHLPRLGQGRHLQIAAHGMCDSLGQMAEQLLAAAPPTFALAGHSMGGRVALEVVARAPQRVTRLALLDTRYEALAPGDAGDRERAGRYRLRDIAQRDGMLAMGREWARGMVHPSRLSDNDLMSEIHQMIARATVQQFEAQITALLNRPDRTSLLTSIAVPTLVLCGRDDQWSPLASHVEMVARIRGSWLVEVPTCGHMSTMEQPEAVGRALLDWLER